MDEKYTNLHLLNKPALRELLKTLGAVGPGDLRVFQLQLPELLARVLDTLQERGEATVADVRAVLGNFAREHGQKLVIGSGAPQDFGIFMRDQPPGPVVEILASQIGAIRQEEAGFLKGLVYICGVLFHVEFIRVKWKEAIEVQEDDPATGTQKGDKLATFNEDGDGEQMPWDDNQDSLCSQWWYQSMVHVDECAFNTIEVPPFEGRYVVLIHPGGR